MSAWHCESETHEGDRLVAHPFDRFQKRIEYRRADGQDRPHARTVANLCRVCMERDWLVVSGKADTGQETLL